MSKVRARSIVPVAVALALVGCDREVPDGPYARAKVIESLDEAIGGEKGLVRPDDLLLENDRIRVGILGGRTSTGPGLYGGSLVDADLQRGTAEYSGGRGLDQFNEMFATVSMNVPKSGGGAGSTGDVSATNSFVLADGADGGPAIIRTEGAGDPFLTMLGALWGLVSMPGMWTTTDYILEPGKPYVKVRTVVTLTGSATRPTEKPIVPEGTEPTPIGYATGGFDVLGIALENGVALGDFWLGGGSLDVFGPGIGFDEDGAVYRKLTAGENTFQVPFEFPFLAGAADGVSYGIAPIDGSLFIPLFTASQTVVIGGGVEGDGSKFRFPANSQFVYERYFLVGDGDVGSILDGYLEARALPHGHVDGHVFEQGSARPLSGLDVFVYEPGAEYPYSQWESDHREDDTVRDGSFGGNLPVGDWELAVHQHGRPAGKRLPITVREGDSLNVQLEALRGGVLTFTVRDETGIRVPAKVTIVRADEDTVTTNMPALGDEFIGGSPEWVLFADKGNGEVPLAPGRYQAIASRGTEYELDVSEPFTVDALRGQHVDLQINRAIDTTGWISADFHVHSAPSHDSGVTLPMRVRTMVCDGVEFFASTDHDFVTDFAPVIDDMNLQEWVQSAVGVEMTTLEVGHYLGFPLQKDWLGDVGGAVDWTGKFPDQIISDLRTQGEAHGTDPFVFMAHPRDGILGAFDQYGFDPFSGSPGAPVNNSGLINSGNPLLNGAAPPYNMDGIELFTAKRLDYHRKPTFPEQEGYTAGDGTDLYDWITRTMEEQQSLIDGTYKLSAGLDGNVDDWFALLNMGYRFTALGNSDTHGTSSVEAGCPRNYVMSDVDDPAYLDDQAVAEAVREHRVVASYGPFVRFWIDGAEIGSEISASGTVSAQIEVQAPSWIDVDRVELYENGTLIREWAVEPGPSDLRFDEVFDITPVQDAWYVVIVAGDEGMDPVFTRVDIPYLPLDEVVMSALGGLPGVSTFLTPPIPFPKEYPILPYALTNPIWVDVGGDGWMAPGRPAWFVAQDD